MKNKFVSLIMLPVLAATLCLGSFGCAINPKADKVAVAAEVTTQTSFDLMDAFVHLEYNNKALLAQYFGPEVHQAANKVRAHGRAYLTSALNLIDVYEVNRTAENKANLATAIAVLSQLVNEIQHYMTATQQINPSLVPNIPEKPPVLNQARSLGVK